MLKVVVRYAIALAIALIFIIVVKYAVDDYDNQARLQRLRYTVASELFPLQTDSTMKSLEERVFWNDTVKLVEDVGVQEYARVRLMEPRSVDDLHELGLRLRAMTAYLDSNRTIVEKSPVYRQLVEEHFGFITKKQFKSLFDLKTSFTKHKRCIAVPTGNKYFRFANHLIMTVRRVFESEMPVYVYYMGKDDLNATAISHLNTISNVHTTDITTIFDNSTLKLHGWDVKPFAMLAAPCEQVLLLDADTVLVKDLASFFEHPGFVKKGALFFKDRTLFPTDTHKQDWLKGLVPKPVSKSMRKSRMFRMHSSYEQEAGVVVIDKMRHFGGLLAVCRLNSPPERDTVMHEETHGDKETFWLGFEMVNATYHMHTPLPGSLGRIIPDHELKDTPAICGKLAHFTDTDDLWWFNDSIADCKQDMDWADTVSDLTHFAREGAARWTPYLCLPGPFHELDPNTKALLTKIQSVYEPDPLRVNRLTASTRPKVNI